MTARRHRRQVSEIQEIRQKRKRSTAGDPDRDTDIHEVQSTLSSASQRVRNIALVAEQALQFAAVNDVAALRSSVKVLITAYRAIKC